MPVSIDLVRLDIVVDRRDANDYRHRHGFAPETIADVVDAVGWRRPNAVSDSSPRLNVAVVDDDMDRLALHLVDDENSPYHRIDCVWLMGSFLR